MNLKTLKKDQILNLLIICNSKKQDIDFLEKDTYKVKIHSQPLKGKANKEIISFFKDLGYKIELVKGEKSHSKIVRVIDII
ncbi:MAG: DUF167 domain-containing protein [Candidatus ainarchaeum sp.]|nr:DUF167 domain-containing protein [Candidatus ainarchaeum sp.]